MTDDEAHPAEQASQEVVGWPLLVAMF